MNEITLLTGDVIEMLRTLQPESVQCVVTSPPYWGLRDYGVAGQIGLEQTPEQYVDKLVQAFREVRRVLRKDGTVWLNLGDSWAANKGATHMPAKTIAGGKSGHGDDAAFSGMGGEDIRVPRRNAHKYGLKDKDLVGIPWMVAFALRTDGWWLRQDIIWNKPNAMPESVKDRCTKSHEYLFLLTKSSKYYFDQDPLRTPTKESSISRTKYGYKPEETDDKQHVSRASTTGVFNSEHPEKYLNPLGVNRRDVWSVTTVSYKGAHFATFPPKLVEPCILAGSKAGDLVLDPFMGSGTVGMVARQHCRDFVGIDLNPEYVEMAKERIG